MAQMTCDCGNEYEIRDDTPKWAAPWIMCGECFLNDGDASLAQNPAEV